jgi:hypothetical protein
MKAFLKELLKIKIQVIVLLTLGLALLFKLLLMRLNIIFWPTFSYSLAINILIVLIFCILGAWMWLRLSFVLPKLVLLIPIALGPLSLVFGTLGSLNYFVLIGMVLVLATGFPLSALLRKIWLISAIAYFVLGFAYFKFAETGIILLHALSFGFAYVQFGPEKPKMKLSMAVGGIIVPGLILFLAVFLSLSSINPRVNRRTLEFLSPFGTTLILVQELENDYIDTNRSFSVYKPLQLGYFQRVGFYSSEAYEFEDITAETLVWELVEEDTYNLYIPILTNPIIVDFSSHT